jgi:hypothetical protein
MHGVGCGNKQYLKRDGLFLESGSLCLIHVD